MFQRVPPETAAPGRPRACCSWAEQSSTGVSAPGGQNRTWPAGRARGRGSRPRRHPNGKVPKSRWIGTAAGGRLPRSGRGLANGADMLRSGMATNLLSHAAEISGRPALERPGLGAAEPGDPEERRARARGRAGAGDLLPQGSRLAAVGIAAAALSPGLEDRLRDGDARRPVRLGGAPGAGTIGGHPGLGFGKLASRPILSAAASAPRRVSSQTESSLRGRRPALSSITAITSRAMPQRRTAFRSAGSTSRAPGAAARAAAPPPPRRPRGGPPTGCGPPAPPPSGTRAGPPTGARD